MIRTPVSLFCALMAGVTVVGAGAAEKQPAHPLLKSDTVIWAGLDYSMVRMYGTTDFRDPDNIFPHFLNSWNALFLRERIKTISSALNKKVETDTEQMAERNKTALKKFR